MNIGTLEWKLGGFRATNTDDILAIPDPVLQGFGYFQNVGSTRRQGIEAEAKLKSSTLQLYASYTFIDARFLDSLQVGSNSPFADANGNIQIVPGNQIPAIPRHRIKAGFDYFDHRCLQGRGAMRCLSAASIWSATNPTRRRSCRPTRSSTLHASYQINKTFQIYGRVNNLFDNRYATYGTFFDTGALPNFANGGAPFTDARALNPAYPRTFYAGLKATF